MRTIVLLGLVGVSALAACGGAKAPVEHAGSPANQAPGAPATASTSCTRIHAGTGAMRVSATHQGASVVLARLGQRTVAYVGDEDDRSIRTMDVDSKQVIARTALEGAPSQLMILSDGRVAAALRDKNRVQVLEPDASVDKPLASLCAVPVPIEPVALAETPDSAKMLVSSAWAKTLSSYDVATMKKDYEAKLPREPRAVIVDDSGERAFVAHVVNAQMSVVDLKGDTHEVHEIDLRVRKIAGLGPRFGTTPEDKLRSGCQGFALAKSIQNDDTKTASNVTGPNVGEKPTVKGKGLPAPQKPAGRIFAPMVTVEPGDPNVRSPAYYGDVFDGVAKEAPIVSVVDAAAERTLTKNVMSLGTRLARECMLPRAAAVRPSTGSLFVACFGIDALLELDTRGLDPARLERHRWNVPSGPTGIAIDDTKNVAVVWSQFKPGISVIDLNEKSEADAVKTTQVERVVDPIFAAGRILYHTTDDKRISSDGSACASCHPEGREDAITWSTPDGPRQTIMLAGRVKDTAPFGWLGKHDTLKHYVSNTFTRLGGTGLPEVDPEFDALLSYVERMPSPNIVDVVRTDDENKMIARGKELFNGQEQGCATCHVEGVADHAKHDVGSKAIADEQVEFDTPSLHFINNTAPYFHDGRYSTLDALLNATDNKMGHTLQLSKQDMASLKAYLETL